MKSKSTVQEIYTTFGPYESFPLVNIERNNGECVLHIKPSSTIVKNEDRSENRFYSGDQYYEEIWKKMSFWQKLGFYCYITDIPDMTEKSLEVQKIKDKTIEDKVQDNLSMEPLEKKESYKGYNGFRIEINESNKYQVIAIKE
ncbi:MAG: hypothetical protein WC867_01660 [Candidatus Pacearchaeota archaeon]|jgi:hypothetical protein